VITLMRYPDRPDSAQRRERMGHIAGVRETSRVTPIPT
jgi:hypothetical protein